MPASHAPMSLAEELRKLPNILTVSRIVMIPPVMVCMALGTRLGNFIAVMIFTAAAITDWLDGWLARRQGLESVLGKFLDPLADKLIVQAILIMAAELGRIPGWFVVLLLSREIAITGLRAIASSEGLSVEVSAGGKYKTAFQLVGLVGLLLHETFRVDYLVTVIDVNFNGFGVLMLGLSAFFSYASAFSYFRGFARAVAARAAAARKP
jgi:CDP-diacylglycerol--glycerol-3-phosphate 3-phosphatidyltransferase